MLNRFAVKMFDRFFLRMLYKITMCIRLFEKNPKGVGLCLFFKKTSETASQRADKSA